MSFTRRGLLCVAGTLVAARAGAQPSDYPARPIRMIIPFAAGGGTDIVARAVAERLSAQMKVAVVPENREGAGGVIGAKATAAAAPDGYTIMLATSFLPMAPALFAAPPYDAVKDFTPLQMVAFVRSVFVVAPDAPYQNLQQMVDYIKANPGKLNYASTGKGSPSHIHTEDFLRRMGLSMQDVPYKVGSQAITDTMSGRVAFYQCALPAALAYLNSKQLRGIAVSGETRAAQVPDMPTIGEASGLSHYEAGAWLGFVGPAGMPPAIAQRLSREIAMAMQSPVVRQRMDATATDAYSLDGDVFGRQIALESDSYAKLIKQLGLTNQ